ncbi:hypothetical protein DW604_06955 [Enterococcus faecium]|nr:hypothetical protein [Enterococcus faecium]EGP5669221.1 hypothetical protein [Enterococcus faecium]
MIDCFHIVQHLNNFFDLVQKYMMKQLNQKDTTQAKYYQQLKFLLSSLQNLK